MTKLAEELARRLQIASTLLMDRLFEYVSQLQKQDDGAPPRGLTLPASAMGWLSSQLYPTEEDDRDILWMGASVRDRLALLKCLLPQTTHLRITSEEWPPAVFHTNQAQAESQGTNDSFLGRDLSFNTSMDVQSQLTLDTYVPSRPNLRAFLVYYYMLQNRPRVDLRLVPNLSVLMLDRAPPEWINNLYVVQDTLQLLRCDHACVFNLSKFLFGHDTDSSPGFPQLTHLRLSKCAIGELSGLRGTKKRSIYLEDTQGEPGSDIENDYSVLPPLARLPALVSLSLSHNELRSVQTALAGLSSLSNLTTLDLSFNQLKTFKNAHRFVGNIQTLILTGNRIRSVHGIDRLYSLEHLALDKNNLRDLTSVAGLASLPQLSSLDLSANPVSERDPKRFRVEILNLFRERRSRTLPPKATYRQLLEVLPILDGKPATNRELVGLRGYAFAPSTGMETEPTRILPTPPPDLSTPTITNTSVGEFAETPQYTPRTRARRLTKHKPVRKAVVHDGPTELYELPSGGDQLSVEVAFQSVPFCVGDVLTKLATTDEKEDEGSSCPSAPGKEPLDMERDEDDQSDEEAISEHDDHSRGSRNEIFDVVDQTDELATIDLPAQSPADMSFLSLSTVQPEKESAIGSIVPTTTSADNEAEPDECLTNPQSPTSQDGAVLDRNDNNCDNDGSNHEQIANGHSKDLSNEDGAVLDRNEKKSDNDASNHEQISNGHGKDLSNEDQFEVVEDTFAEVIDAKEVENDSDVSSRVPEVTFPDDAWDDARSAVSSLDGTNKSEFPAQNRYQIAEEKSVYDGPGNYGHLPIAMNLELYFRFFVFPPSAAERFHDYQEELTDEERSKMILELAPRIQLRSTDRKAIEASLKDAAHPVELVAACERFYRVWKEEMLACGKAAARRLTPNRTPKRGFHGDVLFAEGRLEKSCNCRKVILCTSRLGLGGVAIYIISDHDAVTNHTVSKGQMSRKFPSPIPATALFSHSPWPHAVARHLIVSLNRITIGFGFQRLTLHFSNDNDGGEEFTYVVLTCNKMRTVSLLKQIQDHVKEVGFHGTTLFGGTELTIDNDDRQVLEALSSVVAPDMVGAVLHYQILQQRWKHGDRGHARRACVVTDTHLYLLDEDYVGDGSESFEAGARQLGDVRFHLVDSSTVDQIAEVQAANEDPTSITISIRPLSRLQRLHNWRLVCRDSEGAERLVDDVRKAMSMA